MKRLYYWFCEKMMNYYFYNKFIGDKDNATKVKGLEKATKWRDRKNKVKMELK